MKYSIYKERKTKLNKKEIVSNMFLLILFCFRFSYLMTLWGFIVELWVDFLKSLQAFRCQWKAHPPERMTNCLLTIELNVNKIKSPIYISEYTFPTKPCNTSVVPPGYSVCDVLSTSSFVTTFKLLLPSTECHCNKLSVLLVLDKNQKE